MTSYREAGEYVNQAASPDANILAWGSGYNGACDDLTVYSFSSDEDISATGETFEYAIITTRFFSHLGVLNDAPVVYEVRKRGVLLAVEKADCALSGDIDYRVLITIITICDG